MNARVIDEQIRLRGKCGMTYWYPRIKDLPIPQPKTVIYDIPQGQLDNIQKSNMASLDMTPVYAAAEQIGYPLFLRTDQASAKHDWNKASIANSAEELRSRIFETISFNQCADMDGLPYKSLVFREFIKMDSRFKAFLGELPINPERRYFFKDGKILCSHAYWPEEAIQNADSSEWRQLLREANEDTPEDKEKLTAYALLVAEKFNGDESWSVDFCKAKNGGWYLLDMAAAINSYHVEGCPVIKQLEDELNG